MQVALVKAAGRPDQKVWKTTLAEASEVVQEHNLSPSVLVVGDVCAL
jgi:siroheme synthase